MEKSSTPASRTSSRSSGTWAARRPTSSTRRSPRALRAAVSGVARSWCTEMTGASSARADVHALGSAAALACTPLRRRRCAATCRAVRRAEGRRLEQWGTTPVGEGGVRRDVRPVAVRSTRTCSSSGSRAPARSTAGTWPCCGSSGWRDAAAHGTRLAAAVVPEGRDPDRHGAARRSISRLQGYAPHEGFAAAGCEARSWPAIVELTLPRAEQARRRTYPVAGSPRAAPASNSWATRVLPHGAGAFASRRTRSRVGRRPG